MAALFGGIWALLVLAVLLALAWVGWRPLWRAAEQAFWSLNSLAVQPGYALCREGLQHVAEYLFGSRLGPEAHARVRAATAAGAGLIGCAVALWVVTLAWPGARWVGDVGDLVWPQRLIVPALANAVVLVGSYLSDATMDQPRDLRAFDGPPPGGRTWRVAHLSDLHAVGERYGFRIESGRAGPRGNARLERLLARLDAIHAERPLDLVLITGDMTDAGRSAEWAELLAASRVRLDVVGDLPLEERGALERAVLLVPARLGVAQGVVVRQCRRGLFREQLIVAALRGRQAASWLVDHERYAAFSADGAHHESRYYLTFLYLPPPEHEGRAERLLYERTETSTNEVEPHAQLEWFVTETDRAFQMLGSILPEAEVLGDAETLTYLHGVISNKHHPVAVGSASAAAMVGPKAVRSICRRRPCASLAVSRKLNWSESVTVPVKT